ncbi:emp24/gp25L/p24 family/GOLD-domain-containing protein [Mrakia frigida]|uniref:emp24/gp25L/p24 family protein n=1 Tax=Mrakia frigida TaxID=29902 RepID=UPI003FCC0057
MSSRCCPQRRLARMRSTLPSVLLLLLLPLTQALHFYLDANEQKCFMEELPVDTIVEGHYAALEWSEMVQDFQANNDVGIQVTVLEVETSHTVVNTRGPSDGKFTFTSHEAGDHKICLQTNKTGTWLEGSHVKMYLDLAVGSSRHDAEGDREHLSDLASKIADLNKKVASIRQEQQFQRETEAMFRDLSEVTNSRAVWWSALQILVIIATCYWQTKTLKKFFSEKRLR